jgi:hypothetical protein
MTAPVIRETLVNASPDLAFELFTRHIGQWWPLDQFGVFNDGTVAFENNAIVEHSGDRETTWSEVTEWAPPTALSFSWHPGADAERATAVRLTFSPAGDHTLVSLVHSGWERTDHPDAAAEGYGNGWPVTLDCFRAYVAGAV